MFKFILYESATTLVTTKESLSVVCGISCYINRWIRISGGLGILVIGKQVVLCLIQDLSAKPQPYFLSCTYVCTSLGT